MDGTTAGLAGSRWSFAHLGLLVLGGFSLLILFSFGGQVVVAPALLPVQWLIARRTGGGVSIVYSVLGALLAAEIAWIALGLAVGDGASALSRAGVVGGGAVVGFLFFKASRPGREK